MTKKELSQLYYLNREIERDKKRLAELENPLKAVNVTGLPKGTGISDPTGKLAAEIADLKAIIGLNLQKCYFELNRLNRYIADIDDSEIRQIMQLRYISGLSWVQVAFSIGGDATADGVRMKIERYLRNF